MEGFGAATRAWFEAVFAAPTEAQAGAWRAISKGLHALVVAPTGSGKTLAAFLWALDRLAHAPATPTTSAGQIPVGSADPASGAPRRATGPGAAVGGKTPRGAITAGRATRGGRGVSAALAKAHKETAQRRCRVLYVSPLKALAVDVERNLRAPLAGIRHAALKLGLPEPDITVGMRTGDTPADERRAFQRTPPDILITTPESLFLLLTSQARESLRGIETVIVDEVHAVAGTKRGAHLALSLERLDELLPQPAQRIGLSATVEPVEVVARFLGGAQPVEVVRPPAAKTIDVAVEVPVEDMTALDEGRADDEGPRRASIWPAVEERIYQLIKQHRSTIVFANSRRGAERLCARLNELETERRELEAFPAQIMAQAGASYGAPGLIARAHHGSVSKEERKHIEEELKSGRLPAVVATSSLELGIDMGAVDLVIQVGAPPTVAAGLQRVGRAGHQVGAVSRGVVFPVHRGDLLSCAVVALRMMGGKLEPMDYPHSPLDVLAQQVIAMTALDEWTVADVARVVRRAAPFAELPDSALHAVLDMLAGRYPSTAFAELRPRIVWDRAVDKLTGRPGNQRLAVTSGGTIPDRGLFGVFLAGAAKPSRVGELDEEMVYESRVGDVFALGTSSWRIEDITPDRVLVSPAPGQAARLPFWKGDTVGRPVQLGQALGAYLRKPSTLDTLDPRAQANLQSYITEQREATRHLPDDRTVLVERFRDELGDWRIVVHCILGAKVNAPWALAIGQRLQERYGVDAQVHAADDGIVVRLPEMATEPPDAETFIFDPEEIESMVADAVGGSAMFAARFRECAARSLLLPKRDPSRRQPLWQQRQRAGQLLEVAREYADFPVTLEAARECLRDIFDLPALVTVMRELASRKMRLVDVTTPQPSPFARSLLFGYVGAFLYGEDAPLAERRAAALALDPTLLGELLGRIELRELLDPVVIAETSARLRWAERTLRDAEDVAEMLRQLGDLSEVELGAAKSFADELVRSVRALRVRIAGEARYIGVEDAGRYRDALGVALPPGVPTAFTGPTEDPLLDLISRYARTHGPFRADDCAHRFGLGVAVVDHTLRRLAASGRVVSGEFTPNSDGGHVEWCDAEVLRLLRRRSLAALRKEIEPVPAPTLGRFLPIWQRVGRGGNGVDAVAAAIEQLQGVPIPASALERLVLPARVGDYSPSYLDELCSTGEVVWSGAGSIPGGDGWIALAFADSADLLLPPPAEFTPGVLHDAILTALGEGAMFFRPLSDRIGSVDDADLVTALWDLVWAGLVSNDTLAPVRALIAGGTGAHRARPTPVRSRLGRPGRVRLPSRGGPPSAAGRWHVLAGRDLDPTRRAAAAADALLDRHGVVTRGAVAAEGHEGGFAAVYPVLSALEERGAARRGYFVEGLGAAQFALPGAVDRLRATEESKRALVLAATDPANPYGAALPWPHTEEGHRPGRKAGALVVLVNGELTIYVERGGRTLLSFVDDEQTLASAAQALADAVKRGALGVLSVERADGDAVVGTNLGKALEAAGFRITPRGLRLRG
jgi:ATP-dependent Lhr-like helicase